MPTFKLEELDDSLTFGGDNDMYFRQWRVPSMKPVLDKKLDRDFQKAVDKKQDFIQKRAESKKKHDEKFEKRLEELTKQMSTAKVVESKENVPFLRKPTDKEKQVWKDNLDREYESPSSTAKMTQATQLAARLKPRTAPLFGSNMAGLKNICIPPTTTSSSRGMFDAVSRKPTISESSTGTGTPKDNSFLNNSHETVFYPQNHSSFNLDHYNGTRPSFAFAGQAAATSTPVSKSAMKFPFGSGNPILEEGDDTVFGDTQYVTAMESPIHPVQKASDIQKTLQEEFEKQQRVREQEELQKALEIQKARKEKERLEEEEMRRRLLEKQMQKTREEEIQKQKTLEAQKAREEAQQREEAVQKAKKSEIPAKPSVQKVPFTRPYILFKNYIDLLSTVLQEKSDYEKTANPQNRALLKRTITEKVTVFTQRQTSGAQRQEILEFFKDLLQKKQVLGFSLGADAPVLQLEKDQDVHYAVYCIVEKYMSLAERDDELATTISDLISRLSSVVRRLEKLFIVMMFNKSILLRQNPEECRVEFVENLMDSDEKAILVNRENALVTLFLHVFVKNAHISSKGRKMVLDELLLWKFTDSVVAHSPEVPKAAMVILLLLTSCKPSLCTDSKRWSALLKKLDEETIPMIEEFMFPGDESVISKLKQVMTVLRR